MKKMIVKSMMAVIALMSWTGQATAKKVTETPLRISVQQRIPSDLEQGAWVVANRIENWKPSETAIIICDMWDKHWCDDATARVAE
ncbi:MAG: hypothetical protein LBJ47_03320, partial [Tannerella sp.]|nr:hypothetical protein [Tannerella sp.]